MKNLYFKQMRTKFGIVVICRKTGKKKRDAGLSKDRQINVDYYCSSMHLL